MGTKDKNSRFITTCRPFKDMAVTRLTKSDADIIEEQVLKLYRRALSYNRKRIDDTLMPLYKQTINFSDRSLGEVIGKIKEMILMTDMDIVELVQYFNKFFGREVSFFKQFQDKKVPVGSDAICEAFKAIKRKASKEEVLTILYK